MLKFGLGKVHVEKTSLPSRCARVGKQSASALVLDLAWPRRLVRRRQSQVAATHTFQPGISLLLRIGMLLKEVVASQRLLPHLSWFLLYL